MTPMTMGTRNSYNTLALNALCVCYFAVFINAEIDSSCPGPRKFYEDIGCTPVFKTLESKCPEEYNCDVLKNLPVDKCFVNGHTYEIGESLREEDANPCDIACHCAEGSAGPEFRCAAVDCFDEPTPGCYMKQNATDCCSSGVEVCPEKEEDRPTCIVDGKIYKDGEYFKPAAEPEKNCYCGEGYTGENVEPFCVSRRNPECGTLLYHANELRANCVPTYYYTQSPKTSCSIAYRCQNTRDVVIRRASNSTNESRAINQSVDSDMQVSKHANSADMPICKFGDLTMNVGDELNQGTHYDSVCIKCVCEVPPVPTCQRLSDEECDVTKHANFDNL